MPPTGPEMPDEDQDLWDVNVALLARLGALEEIANRLAAASVDPVAIADYEKWKTGRK